MVTLPRYLYRGDSDMANKRQLRTTINHGLLMTNLSRGGNGQEVFQKPLVKLINTHVSIGWEKTHFLSFTTESEVAFFYAAGKKFHYQTHTDDNWNFAIFTLDTSLFNPDSIEQVDTGIYKATYYPTCREFLPFFTVILIDVSTCLRNIQDSFNDNLINAISNADRDKEWLLFPATAMRDSSEYTSKLDTGCIAQKEVYIIY